MTVESARRRSPVTIILIAGLVGLAAGFLALYRKDGAESNVEKQCSAGKSLTQAMKPLVSGEIAAFKVNDAPRPPTALTFRAPDGQPMSLADLRGKTVLVNLWATWCAPCKHEMPALDRLQQSLGGETFQVIAVNIDTRNPEKAEQWLVENNIKNLKFHSDPTARIFQDLKAAGRAFGMPTTLLYDAKGCELGYLAGPAEWSSTDAITLIKAALK